MDRWYDYIAEPTLAYAIMDRLINSSEHMELQGETLRHNRKRVIGNDKCSEIGKKGYIKNGNNNAVKSATIVQ